LLISASSSSCLYITRIPEVSLFLGAYRAACELAVFGGGWEQGLQQSPEVLRV
jgi:hypothetical protein